MRPALRVRFDEAVFKAARPRRPHRQSAGVPQAIIEAAPTAREAAENLLHAAALGDTEEATRAGCLLARDGANRRKLMHIAAAAMQSWTHRG